MTSRPRHYADAYIAAGRDREKQKEALAGCPVEWRDLVRAHINNRRMIDADTHRTHRPDPPMGRR